MNKQRFKVADVAEALRQSFGIQTAAARVLATKYGHCSEGTVRNYVQRYPKLQEIRDEMKEQILDVAEFELFKAVRGGEPKSVHFILRTLGKDRGYAERVESTGKDGGPIQHEDVTRDADEFASRMARLAAGVSGSGDGEAEAGGEG